MLLEPPPDYTLVLSLLDWRSTIIDAQEAAIVKARQYHDGEQLVFLTDRLKQFLNADGSDATFRINITRSVVEALAERIVVKGFDAADPKTKAWAEKMWAAARLDAISDDVHEMALRDGESFVVIDWDRTAAKLVALAHPRYTSVGNGGDGFGVVMAYPDDDVSQPPLYAVKRWIEYLDEQMTQQRQRATFYYPNRVVKYANDGANWQKVTDDKSEPWPIPWVDSAGMPLGIPVIHFKNKGLRSEAWDAIPLQDAANKTLVDLLASADLTAFRIYVALGFIPTSDGKPFTGDNALILEPGQIIGTTAAGASFQAVNGADLTPTLNMLQQLVLFIAMVTGTPTARFQISGQIAAEGTLKEQEEPLMAKVRSREILFGDAWEDVMATARRLANHFSQAGLNETVDFITQWVDAQTRTDVERQAEWKVKHDLGIPRRQLWSEMGYTPAQIDTMLAEPDVVFGSFAGYPGVPGGGAGGGAAAGAGSAAPGAGTGTIGSSGDTLAGTTGL